MELRITDLSKTYPNGVRALDGVSLTVPTGMFGLLGPNGAGKSTLMRTIATLQEPDSGSIALDGIDVVREKDHLRRLLGYLPQEFGVYPRITAETLLRHFAALKGIEPSRLDEVVAGLLHKTNLWDVRKRRLGTFSGGMKQRFGIAQALIGDPRLIIVDEPTAGLDPGERLRFLNLLSEIGENVVVILSTHIVEDVSDLCRHMAVISRGRVLLQGEPAGALESLRGKVWSRAVARPDLAALERELDVISTHLLGGRTIVHVHADARPGPEWEPVEAGLVDVYFSTLKHAGERRAAIRSGGPDRSPEGEHRAARPIMFGEIFRFELRYQLRQPIFWIGGAAFFLLTFLATTTDAVVIGGSSGQIHRNAAWVVMQMHLILSMLGMFFVAALVASSVVRDAQHHTEEIFYTLPIRKLDYLLGRFTGALVAAILTGVPVSLGMALGSVMPWLEPERIGPMAPAVYAFSLLALYAPNVILVSCVLFAIATPSRSLILTYGGVVGIMVAYGVAGALAADVSNARAATLLDPLGVGAFEIATRYWTVLDKNVRLLSLDGPFLASRALWLSLALGLLAFTCWRFSFTISRRVRRRDRHRAAGVESDQAEKPIVHPGASLPAVRPAFTGATTARQLLRQARLEIMLVVRSVAFPVMVAFGILNVIGNSEAIDVMFGTPVYPVTHLMVSILEGSSLFLLAIVVFYSGEIVFRERALEASDVLDAMPVPDWVQWASKLVAFLSIVASMLVVSILAGIGIQIWRGYHHFELGLYLRGMLLVAGAVFVLAAVLAFFLQVATNNRYLGFLLIILYFVGTRALGALDFDHYLYRYGAVPDAPYSDMNGFGPFVPRLVWFDVYWAFAAALLAVAAHLLWIRGRAEGWRTRLRLARRRFRGPVRLATALAAVGFAAVGSWIFYNTNVLNEYVPDDLARDRLARYEKKYKQYERLAQPRIRAMSADVDIYPERRAVDIRGRYRLRNVHAAPIEDVHVRIDPRVEIRSIEIPTAKPATEDRELGYYVYRLGEPLAPGEEREMRFEIAVRNPEFRNGAEDTRVVRNGTFFNNYDYFPIIGYARGGELEEPNRRREYGLPPVERLPDLDDAEARGRNYLTGQADWMDFETTVSTSADQVALAPGYLEREWTEGGRRYFHYKMDRPILGFVAYLSGDWEVARDSWNGVAIEVYHHAGHAYNVARMIDAVKKSLDYFTEAFGPYQHRQVRIVEFPRYARFAQALPNTIPFSESIGFIARLDRSDPDAIDYVFYVTAHEVAHQWWAHQVIGGWVQGATVLSETMSQYSALMVMEKEYGREQMRRFLRYELDRYLRNRGGELIEELPLLRVEDQGYIHYSKGSLAMYALRDAIGEETLNAALRRYVSRVAYQEPPYTYTRELLAELRQAVPPERQGLLEDLFETITLWDNRVRVASAEQLDGGRWRVRLELSARKLRADGHGAESEIPMDDWVDVAVFGEKEPGGPKTGRLLATEKRRVTGGTQTVELVVDGEPVRAGVDPFHKLIDRDPDDNTAEVELGGTT